MPLINILYLHETSQISGAENSLLNLVKHLDKSRFKAFFVLPEEGPLSLELQKLNVEVTLIPFPQIRRIAGVGNTLKAQRQFIRKNDIHIIHSNSIRTHIYAAIAGKLERLGVIWHQRNLLTNEIIDPDRLFSFLPDRIICNSYAVAKRFLRGGSIPDKVRVIYSGVDTQLFHPSVEGRKIREEFGIGANEIVIGIASRFHQIKGHETFLQAAQMVCMKKDMDIPVRFLIVGGAVFKEDAGREKYLRDFSMKGTLKDKVIFTGQRKDMPEVYAAMDILALTSLVEAFGRVILEAMACGKPVVATNSGGSPEMVIDGVTGYLFNPDDESALAEKISVLAHNRSHAKRMGEASRARIEEHFKIEKNVCATEKIYLELRRN